MTMDISPTRVLELRSVRGTGGGPEKTILLGTAMTDRSRYATLTMPALVLWGARDSLTPMPQGGDIVRLIRGARWEVLPRAGHIPAIEDEPSFDAALLDFLRATAPSVR
jgi:pimeloyl-ACP methyl ester carboxylesterase